MLGSFLPLAAAVGLAFAASAPAEPITVGGERQLFLGPWAGTGATTTWWNRCGTSP